MKNDSAGIVVALVAPFVRGVYPACAGPEFVQAGHADLTVSDAAQLHRAARRKPAPGAWPELAARQRFPAWLSRRQLRLRSR